VSGPTVGLLEDALRLRVEHAARVGQLQRPRAAFEQRQPDLFLDRLQLAAQRRLRHVQPLRRPRDVHFFRDGDEVAELAQFHFMPQRYGSSRKEC
jgi:lipase chaperone LimK